MMVLRILHLYTTNNYLIRFPNLMDTKADATGDQAQFSVMGGAPMRGA